MHVHIWNQKEPKNSHDVVKFQYSVHKSKTIH